MSLMLFNTLEQELKNLNIEVSKLEQHTQTINGTKLIRTDVVREVVKEKDTWMDLQIKMALKTGGY